MAPKAQNATSTTKQSLVANQTLYVSNLNEKISKADLRRQLYLLFSTYGTVLDIVTLKTPKMRGQAHIVYRDVQMAVQALRTLDGFEFLGRPLRIQYAKSKSDFVAKLDGTFRMPGPLANGDHKAGSGGDAAGQKGTALQQSVFGGAPAAAGASAVAGVKRAREDDEVEEEEEEEEEMEMDESDED